MDFQTIMLPSEEKHTLIQGHVMFHVSHRMLEACLNEKRDFLIFLVIPSVW